MLIEHLEGVSETELIAQFQSGLFKGILHGLEDKFCTPTAHKPGLRVSSIGKSVIKQYMDALGFSDWNPNGETQWKLAIGDVVEAMIIALTQNRGVSITQQQMEISFYGVPGHIEGLCCDADNPMPALFEIKCVSPYFFKAKCGEDLEERGYWSQVSCYMEALRLEHCYFVMLDRNTCARKEIFLRKNPVLVERAERVIQDFKFIKDPLDIWVQHNNHMLIEPTFNTYVLKGSETTLPRLPMDLKSWRYRHLFWNLSSEYNDGKHEYVESKTSHKQFTQAYEEAKDYE